MLPYHEKFCVLVTSHFSYQKSHFSKKKNWSSISISIFINKHCQTDHIQWLNGYIPKSKFIKHDWFSTNSTQSNWNFLFRPKENERSETTPQLRETRFHSYKSSLISLSKQPTWKQAEPLSKPFIFSSSHSTNKTSTLSQYLALPKGCQTT